MGLPFLGRKDKTRSRSSDRPINSEASCARCTTMTAKLLIVTGQWDFYYCYRCRHWSQASYAAREALYPVNDDRMENSLTWFWRTESELMRENIRSMEWVHSIFGGGSRSGEERNEELI
jgi:hypothetical protein